jgi:GIY-YIG catalytic domain
MSYVVYKHLDPRDTQVRYIGISKNAFKRFGQHLAAPEDGNNTDKAAWFSDLAQAGLLPILEIIESDLTFREALSREKYWIEYYLNLGAPLTNYVARFHSKRNHIESVEIPVEWEAVAELLRSRGWYLDMVRKYKTAYAYAKRRVGKKVQTKYLVTERKLPELTEADVLKRIQ